MMKKQFDKDGKNASKTDKQKFRPPVILFIWGRFIFKGVIESLSQKYTMFLSDGTPVRAECAIKLRNVLDNNMDDDKSQARTSDSKRARSLSDRMIGSTSSQPRSWATRVAGPRSPRSTTSSIRGSMRRRKWQGKATLTLPGD